MTLGGRKDSKNGNYLCTYDPARQVLTYRSVSNRYIELPNVRFPYKQDELNEVIQAGYSAVGWIFEITGRSFLIKCVYQIPPINKMWDTANGVIGMDTNVDNLAWSETDKDGNLIRHGVVRFDLRNKTSEQAEHILSHAVDQVYGKCCESGKPLVMEDLSIKKRFDIYERNANRNRKLSSFAYAKITGLVQSKSNRFGIEAMALDPAYTSQAGKLLFMRQHGLSVHESASCAIARRGMNIYDKVPAFMYKMFPEELKQKDYKSQWYAVSKYIKQFNTHEIYKGALTEETVNALGYRF